MALDLREDGGGERDGGRKKSEFVYLDIYDSAYLEFTSLKLLHHRPSFPKRLFTSEEEF